MGTRDMSPLPAGLIDRLHNADALIVEADISGEESPFSGLAIPPPLSERLSASQLAEVERLADELGLSLSMLEASRYGNRDGVAGHAGPASGAAGRLRH